ncbi:hypothetical protein ACIBL3_46995 [Kribbella sp. NPDC050124]|uniref:hypothetical protein n=1 Tax=Kribbella sp. NPDC050124 TaxID=3364114 RepID=UPI003797CCA8
MEVDAQLDRSAGNVASPRRFVLRRTVDVTGVSGTGDIAEGVEWSDGTVALRWRGKWATTVVWDYGLDALLAVHGHNGSTVVRWLDDDHPA